MSRHEVRVTEFEEQDFYPPPHSRPGPEFDDRPRRARVAIASPPPRPRVHVDEMDEVEIRVSDREARRGPAFLNRPPGLRPHAGPIVLRQREVENWDRCRPRSPSPEPVREQRRRRLYSVSPPAMRPEHEHERSRTRIVERERVRSPALPQHRRSPSARPFRHPSRHQPSPSPVEHEHIHTRIVDRDVERDVSPRPCPSPSPRVIRGPTIEREVLTHYRDVDHGKLPEIVLLDPREPHPEQAAGLVRARSPSPPPRRRAEERETDIDISLSRNGAEVDIRRSTSHSRARSGSFERRRQRRGSQDVARRSADVESSSWHRRARSAAPVDDEARDIRSRIDARGRIGEAWGGATKDWAIIDVPPGTEKVRMDGVGGASTDTTWTKYSGARKTRFVPERNEAVAEQRGVSAGDDANRDHTSVAVYEHDREIDVDDIDIDRRASRPSPPPPRPPPREMWTEISKDVVIREALEELGYDYQETRYCFYIMDYLRYDDVLQLTELTQSIQRSQRERVRDIQWEREWRDEWERPFLRHRHGRRGDWLAGRADRGDELVREREFIYDSRRPMRDSLNFSRKEAWKMGREREKERERKIWLILVGYRRQCEDGEAGDDEI